MRIINGYHVETVGGFITIKYWIVTKKDVYVGTYFKFRDAKEACINRNFSKAYKGKLY